MARHWYILHTYSGFEKQVKTAMLERIKQAGQEELFGELMVPTEQVAQVMAQVGGPPEYIHEHWDRLVGTAQMLAELRAS